MRRDLPEVESLSGKTTVLAHRPEDVIAALEALVSDERKVRIHSVLSARTRDVVPVLERLSDPHNTAAVLRSADAFGAQEVHVIDEEQRFVASTRVAKGTERWLDIVRHSDAGACLEGLTQRGYMILVATMDGEVTPDALPAFPKVAIVFGNEHAGVSESARARAHRTYQIPMRGFVESLNVSVAAAITLHAATRGRVPRLEDADRASLYARFLMASVDHAELIVDEWVRRSRLV